MATITARRRVRVAGLGRIDGRMLLGLVLVVVSVGGGLLFWGSTRETVPILVASREMPAGHVIQSDDLTVARVRLEGDLTSLAIPDARLDDAVGRPTAGPVHAGEMLVWPDLASGPVIAPDEVAMTVPVEADAVYAGLRPGDAVAVLATRDKGKPESETVTLLDRAVVYDVSLEPGPIAIGSRGQTEEERGLTNVTLLVPRSETEAVADATVNATITLALLPPSDGTSQAGAP
jgi:Flp pilus assembly protein CpaB